MNAINGLLTKLFDLLLTPLELMGREVSMIVISGIFGVLALIAFKHISWQKGIKQTKDRIKGNMIAIRIYQDDLGIVGKSVGKVLLRNFQYVALNFGPFVPLAIPFVFVAAQMVVRYGFEPVPVHASAAELMPGQGTMLRVEFTDAAKAQAGELEIELPDGVEALSPLVRVPYKGLAFQEVIATKPGVHEIALVLPDGTRELKRLVAGDVPERLMQPERVRSPFAALLWPAESTFGSGSPFAKVQFAYPERDLGWIPGKGPFAILVTFVLASMAFGFAVMKPLGVQI
jgi:hypothetical protein